MNKYKGFTLIELMIVIAIVGILAAVALPAYNNYITKARLSEGVGFLAAESVAAEIFYKRNGEWPHMPGNAITPLSAQHFDGVKFWSDPLMQTKNTIWINIRMKGGTISGVPAGNLAQVMLMQGVADANGNITWTCGRHPAGNQLVPAESFPPTCDKTLPWVR